MTKDILDLCDQINDELLNEPLIKEFLELDKKLKSDPKLRNVLNEINYLRKCEPTDNNTVLSREMYDAVRTNPLISNYFELYNEVYEEISSMKEILKP